MICGGTTDARQPDDRCHAVVAEVRQAVETKTGKKFDEFTAVQMKTQVVAGLNYFVKVRVCASGHHVHLRVYQPLGPEGTPVQLSGVVGDKAVGDALEYFDGN